VRVYYGSSSRKRVEPVGSRCHYPTNPQYQNYTSPHTLSFNPYPPVLTTVLVFGWWFGWWCLCDFGFSCDFSHSFVQQRSHCPPIVQCALLNEVERKESASSFEMQQTRRILVGMPKWACTPSSLRFDPFAHIYPTAL